MTTAAAAHERRDQEEAVPRSAEAVAEQDALPCEDVGPRSAEGHPSGAGFGNEGLSRTRLAVAAELGVTAHRLEVSETPNPVSDPGTRKG